jgi:hypothetical protein
MIEVGQQLQIVKEKLKHGQFQSWILYEFNMKPRQARLLMQVARQFKTGNFAALEFAPSALYLLAEMQTPDSARQEAINRAESGEKVTLRTAKEIVSRHKSVAGKSFASADNADPVTPHKTKAQKQAEPIEPSGVQPLISDNLSLLPIADLNSESEDGQRAENAIVDIFAITILDDPPQVISPKFSIGDRVRILRRQHGADKWAGCTAKIWEVTPDGWLRVDVEGHQGVKFTLQPDWVEFMEELNMTEPQDHNQPEAIQLEDKPSHDSDTPETFVISSPSFTTEVKCTPSKMIAILAQLGTTAQSAKEP